MPKVGKRYFKYDKEGMAAARKYAKRTGAKLHAHAKKKYRGLKYKK